MRITKEMKLCCLSGLLVSAMALGVPSFNVGQTCLKGFACGGGFNEPNEGSRVVVLPAQMGGVDGPLELGKGGEEDRNQKEEAPPPHMQRKDRQKFKESKNILQTSDLVPLTTTPAVRAALLFLCLINQCPHYVVL